MGLNRDHFLQDRTNTFRKIFPESGFHIFWLLGPFILLIERLPSDLWISVLTLAFVICSIIKQDKTWLKPFWVKDGFAFWFWCLLTSAISYDPDYCIGDALVWFRFPLFAVATAWVIPFVLFWPIATSTDFFDQWNNIFMWSTVAVTLASRNLITENHVA